MTFTAKNELNKMCKGKSRKLYDLIDCAKCANTGNAEVRIVTFEIINVIFF